METDANVTRPSLLLRLRDADNDDDWGRFFDLYSPLIYHYARSRNCSDAMAKDVLQETLVVVARKLPSFEYDAKRGRFRSWLLRVVHSRIIDSYRREKRYITTDVVEHLAPVELDDGMEHEWDEQWRRHLLQLAMDELKESVAPKTFQSFTMLVFEGRSVEDVSRELDLDPNTIYQQRHRVMERLRSITARLAAEMGEE